MKHRSYLFITFILAVLLLLGLCACGEKEAPAATPTKVSAYTSGNGYTDLGDEKLSHAGLEALPKKYAGMTTDEARQICVDFWYYCKSALWIPDAQYDIYKEENGVNTLQRSVLSGQVYAGLPYVSNSTGNIYRLLDFMDPETGVVNVTEAGRYPLIFGGMCSSGCYWAWSRVMNSADYLWTHSIVTSRGYIRVGPYTYDDYLMRFSTDYGTHNVVEENGEQVMFQSYAALQLADGLGYSRAGGVGHIVMCTGVPQVVYNEDGTINGDESFILVTDQGATWKDGVSPNGIAYQFESSVDRKITFTKLYASCYIPYTFADLLGTEPIEETEVTFSHQGETITEKQLFSAKVTSNYNISDIYVYVYDKAGNEIFKHVARAYVPTTREMEVHKLLDKSYTWGSWNSVSAGDSVKVELFLGTGERFTLWEGKLVQ